MSKVDLRRGTFRHRKGNPGHADHASARLVAELVRRRKELGFTQVELAKRMGTNQRTVCALETLANEPKLSTAIAWANALGMTLGWDEIR